MGSESPGKAAVARPVAVHRQSRTFFPWPHHCRPSLIHSLRSVRETLLIVTIHALINRVGTQPIKQASVIQGIALVKVQEEMLGFRIASR